MTLKEKINSDYLQAFKSKDVVSKNLLSVVKAEIQTTEKNTGVQNLSDVEVVKILTKISKSLKENISMIGDEESKSQLIITESYLPKQMSKEEVTQKVTELVNSGITQMGAIMKEFSSLPADKKMVSEIVKELVK